MRITVQISEEQRARLLELAVRRRIKGFSSLIREALDFYLAQQVTRDSAIEAALNLQGSFTDEEADNLQLSTKQTREDWR